MIKLEATQDRPNVIAEDATIMIDGLLPKILHSGMTTATAKMPINPESHGHTLTSFKLVLSKPDKGSSKHLSWKFEIDNKTIEPPFVSHKHKDTQDYIIVVYNDLVLDSMFSALSTSIIVIYGTIVFSIGKLIRSLFERFSERVIYEELPDTDKLQELLSGIRIA